MGLSAAQVRGEIAKALPLDLVGPTPGHALENETLPDPPSRFYLTGFLAPQGASEDDKSDPTSQEEIDVGGGGGAGEDEETPEKPTARRAFFPSSIGVSVLVPARASSLTCTVTWGDYSPERVAKEAKQGRSAKDSAPPPPAENDSDGATGTKGREVWRRTPRSATVRIDLSKARDTVPVPNSESPQGGSLNVFVRSRPLPPKAQKLAREAARVVSVFLVNERAPDMEPGKKDRAFAFQAHLALHAEEGFVPRPNLRGLDSDDWDESVADVQYRDQGEIAVGHGIATRALPKANGAVHDVETAWIPSAEVAKVVPGDVDGLLLEMDDLGKDDATPEQIVPRLKPLLKEYGKWILRQQGISMGDDKRASVAAELCRRAEGVQRRLADGIGILERGGPPFEAFRLANKAMANQARRRDPERYKASSPKWRPFQLAFVLLNLRSIVEPSHPDRETVDLLFFPTGGGKTEAYLGLSAFTLLLRRLTNPGLASAGVTVLMRYTLRLLTLDQLERAATLICALELLREADTARLGT